MTECISPFVRILSSCTGDDSTRPPLLNSSQSVRATGFACRFYASALETEWHFGESEAYLQEWCAPVGTSAWYGKDVIVRNYIQGTSNCMVATSHYHVCCLNMCEEVLTAIEDDCVEKSPPVMLASLPD